MDFLFFLAFEMSFASGMEGVSSFRSQAHFKEKLGLLSIHTLLCHYRQAQVSLVFFETILLF